MTASRRIVVNILATYGRSVLAIALGLFSSRWLLMALGKSDYGLLGIVGGLTGFVAIINGTLAGAVGRYYAVVVGAARKYNDCETVANCQKWFNTALVVHTVVPTILLVIGYPLGAWAVRSFLNIDFDRVRDCIWVWRITCFNCYLSMITVPWTAMYTARQEIAEITVVQVIQQLATFFFIWYVVAHPGVWLVPYTVGCSVISTMASLVLCVRGSICFRECRFVAKYLLSKERFKNLSVFASWRFLGDCISMIQTQGSAIAVNKFWGPVGNAAVAIGNNIANHTMFLCNAVSGAMWPAIANAYGAGEYDYVRRMVYRTCRISTILLMAVCIPVVAEIDNIIVLWLKDPPEKVVPIALIVISSFYLDRITDGYWMAINADGRIGKYQICLSAGGIVGLVLGCLVMYSGYCIAGIAVAVYVLRLSVIVARLYFGKIYCGMLIKGWVMKVFVPITSLLLFGLLAALTPRFLFCESLFRIFGSCVSFVIVFVIACWVFLDADDRGFIMIRIQKMFKRSHNN